MEIPGFQGWCWDWERPRPTRSLQNQARSSVSVEEVSLVESRALLISLLVSAAIAPLAAVIGFLVIGLQLRGLLAARRAQIARQRAMLVGRRG